MPSPFPGMDPYLEDAGVWPDFHNSLAGEIRNALNRQLPRPYYAQLEMRTETGILGGGTHRIIVPDVGVQRAGVRSPPAESGGGLAVAAPPRTAVSPSIRIEVEIETTELASITIRDSSRGRELVTLIEIVNPANKRPGPDREKYLAKLDETLASQTSLIEIDLLRRGARSWGPPRCDAGVFAFEPPADYLIVLSRAWHRASRTRFEAFPIPLSEPLPVVAVPLREHEPEPPLDVQHCFVSAYDSGPYARGAVDYDQPPPIPLAESLDEWRRRCVDQWRGVPGSAHLGPAASATLGTDPVSSAHSATNGAVTSSQDPSDV